MNTQSDFIVLQQGTITEALQVAAGIPEFSDTLNEARLKARLQGKRHSILLAIAGDSPVAFKMGYARTDKEFYSWLGGVIPTYRNLGIASTLRIRQEQWATEQGFQQLKVKSMNRFPAMLKLLISAGYAVEGYDDRGDPDSSKILFVKSLSQ